MTVAAQVASDVVTLQHHYNAGIDRVFAAWSNPEALGQWFGPHSHQCKVEKYDFTPGGTYQIRMVPVSSEEADCAGDSEKDSVCAGSFVDIDAPNRISMTFDWIENGGDLGGSLLTIDFKEVDGGTDVTLIHEKIPTEELRQAHSGGWQGTLECLEEYLS